MNAKYSCDNVMDRGVRNHTSGLICHSVRFIYDLCWKNAFYTKLNYEMVF